MSRSLRVASKHIIAVNSALKLNGYPSQKKFAEHIGPSLSTVKKFLKGESVDFENFIEICEELSLEWKDLVDLQESEATTATLDDSSPFITGTPVIQACHFFGRKKELKRLFNLLKRHPLQNAAIIGKLRTGKTSLLRYLQTITTTPVKQLRPGQKSDWLPHPEHYNWIFIDFQDSRMASRERFLHSILADLGLEIPNPCDLDRFMDVVGGRVRSPTVILLDEIGVGLQRCPELDDEFWEGLRSLSSHYANGNLAFILATHESPLELVKHTGHSSPFFNIFGYTATLGPLREDEARELIASSPIPFYEEDIQWILQASKCLPLLLQILCRERLFSLEEGETGNEWQEEGLRQIAPFCK